MFRILETTATLTIVKSEKDKLVSYLVEEGALLSYVIVKLYNLSVKSKVVPDSDILGEKYKQLFSLRSDGLTGNRKGTAPYPVLINIFNAMNELSRIYCFCGFLLPTFEQKVSNLLLTVLIPPPNERSVLNERS